MSRRSEELTALIRARRPHVKAAVSGLMSVDELARRVRRHPGRWMVFGLAAGAIAGRFFGRPIVREGRRRVVAAAAGRLQHLGMGLVAALLAQRRDRSLDGGASGSAGAPSVPRVAARSVVR